MSCEYLRVERPIAIAGNNLLRIVGKEILEVGASERRVAARGDHGIDPSDGGLGEDANGWINDDEVSVGLGDFSECFALPSQVYIANPLNGKSRRRITRRHNEKWRVLIQGSQVTRCVGLAAPAGDDRAPGRKCRQLAVTRALGIGRNNLDTGCQ